MKGGQFAGQRVDLRDAQRATRQQTRKQVSFGESPHLDRMFDDGPAAARLEAPPLRDDRHPRRGTARVQGVG